MTSIDEALGRDLVTTAVLRGDFKTAVFALTRANRGTPTASASQSSPGAHWKWL